MKKVGVMILHVMQGKPFADILKDIGQVFFATIFIGSWVNTSINFDMMLGGLILSLVFWAINLLIMNTKE